MNAARSQCDGQARSGDGGLAFFGAGEHPATEAAGGLAEGHDGSVTPARCSRPSMTLGLMIEDWYREWYSLGNQVLLFQHKAAADCPNPDCGRGVDLYAKTDTVPTADPALPIVARSRTQAEVWATSDVLLETYLQTTSPGQQYSHLGPFTESGSPALLMKFGRIQGITWPLLANCVVFVEFVLLSLDLLAAPVGSRLDQAVLDDESLTVVLAITAPSSACPLCDLDSSRVHSRYTRRLADLPCFGRAVQLQVAVRRFFCSELECPRRIFAERLPGFAAPYARTTSLLRETHEAIGCALGGEPGSRLTIRLAVATSPDTLLRRAKQLQHESTSPPRFVGIDDWAWRKGRRYGTIIVDLERGDVVDLLPDREAETVKKWLERHPGVELVTRDRSATYAQAAAEGAPKAQQVADRWHLLKNLREAIERLLERQSDVVNGAIKAAESAANPPPSNPSADPPRRSHGRR